MDYPIWAWAGFGLFILLMLALDLGVLNRKAHAVTYREAAVWSVVWVMLAMCFAGIVFWKTNRQTGLEFLTGYVIELSLSVDNLFVFLLIFTGFKMLRQDEAESNPEDNPLVRFATGLVPITRRFEGEKFFTAENGR